MRYIAIISMVGMMLTTGVASAAVTASASTSLVTSPMTAKASSNQIALFSVTLNQTAGETLTSMAVNIANAGTSTATGADLASVSIYQDDGDTVFEPGTGDLLVGTNTTVNIGTPTVVTATANNTIDNTKAYYVSMATASTWADTSPADSVTVTLLTDAVITSATTQPVLSAAVTTSAITADNTLPTLVSVVAKNTGAADGLQTGDSVDFTFSEPTNKPAITSSVMNSIFALNNSHSWLDTSSATGTIAWNTDGSVLSIVLTTGATVAVGDTVTMTASGVTDKAGNAPTTPAAPVTITGSFSGTVVTPPAPGPTEGEGTCANTLINGRLYKEKGTDKPTVYLAAACRLKPFRGAAVFHARGYKFQNIIELDSLTGFDVSQSPAVPSGGTLVKGSKATVWFVTTDGTRKGFTSSTAFTRLGFKFSSVATISDSDLSTLPVETNISETSSHPDGTTLKCGNSAAVYEVHGAAKFPFTSLAAFANRGHSATQIVNINCGAFGYINGQPIATTTTTTAQ